jgi:hypothetical protein
LIERILPGGLTGRKKLAFVHHPHGVDSYRLEQLPCALNILRRLTELGWEVDVYLWEKPLAHYRDMFAGKVNFRYRRTPQHRALSRLRPIKIAADFTRYSNYLCVIGVGQIGSYAGAIISAASRCPLIILSDELPSHWGPSIWTKLERWAAKKAKAVVSPAETTSRMLAEELCIDSRSVVVMRNMASVKLPLESSNWHKIFGIPPGKKIFLCAGTLGDWAQVPEILCSVAYWPDDAVLLLHSRTKGEAARYRRELSHLELPQRVFWSTEPFSEDEKRFHSLVGYCTGNFALYRNYGPIFESIGTASGKLMRSVACGSPVIASSFNSLAFVTKRQLGVQVHHPNEIPSAIEELSRNGEQYRTRCLAFAAEQTLLDEKDWQKLVALMKSTPGVLELNAPPLSHRADT